MEECRNLGIKVLGPHINESGLGFEVNKEEEIRFGLGAVKGAGEAAVQAIISEREKNGHYKDIFNVAERINLRAVNKKTFESLAMAGAFDCFDAYHRRQYLYSVDKGLSLIEKAIKYGNKTQSEQNTAQQSLFGGEGGIQIPLPKVESCEPYGNLEKLKIEKEVTGFYISGHPLDQFKLEMKYFVRNSLSDLENLNDKVGAEMIVAGIVSEVAHRQTKTGKPFGILTVQDYQETHTFYLFSEDYLKYKEFMVDGWYLLIKGSVQKNKWGEKRVEFKIRDIQLLNDVLEKFSKSLFFNIEPKYLDESLINAVEKTLRKYPGECDVKFYLTDPESKITVELFSRKLLIRPNSELFHSLEQIPNLEYDLKT